MIAFLLPFVARAGVPARLQRLVAWMAVAGLAVLLIIAGVLWWRSMLQQERDEAIKRDRDAANAEVLRQVQNASNVANVRLENTQAQDRQNEKELQREIDAAAPSNGAVGPVTGSVLERLRQQQSAGRR